MIFQQLLDQEHFHIVLVKSESNMSICFTQKNFTYSYYPVTTIDLSVTAKNYTLHTGGKEPRISLPYCACQGVCRKKV